MSATKATKATKANPVNPVDTAVGVLAKMVEDKYAEKVDATVRLMAAKVTATVREQTHDALDALRRRVDELEQLTPDPEAPTVEQLTKRIAELESNVKALVSEAAFMRRVHHREWFAQRLGWDPAKDTQHVHDHEPEAEEPSR